MWPQLSNRMAVLGFIGCGQAGPCRGNVAMCWHQIQKQHWWRGIYIYISFDRIMIFFLPFARSLMNFWYLKITGKIHFQQMVAMISHSDFLKSQGFFVDRKLIPQFSTNARLKVSMEREKHPVRASGPQEFFGPFFFVPRGLWIWIFFGEAPCDR